MPKMQLFGQFLVALRLLAESAHITRDCTVLSLILLYDYNLNIKYFSETELH